MRKKEVAAAKAAKGAAMETVGPGGEETEEKREREDWKEMTNWYKVVDLVREDFREERLPEEATWKAVVMIPKG